MRTFSLISGMIVHQLRKVINGKRPRLLEAGTQAPDFQLKDESGNVHRLSQYRGKRVVLWWFVRALTPG